LGAGCVSSRSRSRRTDHSPNSPSTFSRRRTRCRICLGRCQAVFRSFHEASQNGSTWIAAPRGGHPGRNRRPVRGRSALPQKGSGDVGLFDDLAILNCAVTDAEDRTIFRLKRGIRALQEPPSGMTNDQCPMSKGKPNSRVDRFSPTGPGGLRSTAVVEFPRGEVLHPEKRLHGGGGTPPLRAQWGSWYPRRIGTMWKLSMNP
jgi:hypothetical protein